MKLKVRLLEITLLGRREHNLRVLYDGMLHLDRAAGVWRVVVHYKSNVWCSLWAVGSKTAHKHWCKQCGTCFPHWRAII